MGNTVSDQQQLLDDNFAIQETGKPETLESKVCALREEISELRQEFDVRASRTETIVSAYKTVLTEMADLIEAERRANFKREEAILSSMDSADNRIMADIRSMLGIVGDPDEETQRRGWWPFRKDRR